MSDDPTGPSEGNGDPYPDNWLFDLYRKYIGEPEDETDVYLGFGLFFGGIALAGLALLLFLWSGTFEFRTDPYFVRAGPAYAMGMLSVPVVLLGVVILLPIEDRARNAAVAGTAVTALAVGLFLWAYPLAWMSTFGTDYTVAIVALYALGLTVVVGSTAAALIANQLERATPPTFEEVEAMRVEKQTQEEETWTEEEIRQDIEDAMAATDINWGGVEPSDTRELNIKMDETEVDTTGMTLDPDRTRMDGVDRQVAGLKQLKGIEEKKTTASDSTVDEETRALNELKRQKQQGEAPDEPLPAAGEEGLIDRFRNMLG